jgi:hypothetical protein
MQQIPFIDLFKSALHVSGDKLAHPQEHFLTVYTAFWYNAPILLPVGSNIGAMYRKLYIPGWQQYRCIVPKAVYARLAAISVHRTESYIYPVGSNIGASYRKLYMPG